MNGIMLCSAGRQVVEGLEIVARLAALECDGDDRPAQAVVISDCGVVIIP